MTTDLKKLVEEQNEFIQQVTAAANGLGTVIEIQGRKALISNGGNLAVVNKPKFGIRPGDVVALLPETGQIVEVSLFTRALGVPVTVESLLSNNRAEVTKGGDKRVLALAPHITNLEPGTLCLTDPSSSIIVEVLARPKAMVSDFTKVRWDQIGGNVRAKQELQEATRMIKGDSKIFAAYQSKAPKGIMLYGPPGCGKTMMGKAVATDLGSEGFIYVKAPELLNMYVGATEERIRNLFLQAKEHKARTGQTAVLFIDEADALLQTRGSGRSSDIDKTIVPSFLTEMDGLSESAAMVILATNRPDTLDPAIIREGRIDSHILVDRPGPTEVDAIFQTYLAGLPLTGATIEGAASYATNAIFGSPAAERVSGAMVATIVDRAKREAIRRDIATNVRKPSGITLADLSASIQ